MKQGEITVVLNLEDGKFKASIKNAEGQMEDLASSAEKDSKQTSDVWDDAFAGIKVAAAAAFAFVAAAMFKAAKSSWDQVDAVQQATIGLKAYESDAGKVSDVLSELIGYAKSDMGVLFNRRDLFSTAQALKLMGDNTDDLVDHTKILSRSVGLGLSDWEGLSNVVGRVGSTGKLYADDLQYLQNAGFDLDSTLSGTSQTFESLFKLLDEGIPVAALEGQANTIKGVGIRIESAFRGIGDEILGVNDKTSQFNPGSLGQLIVDGLKGVPAILKTIREYAGGAFAGIAAAIAPVTTFIRENEQAWNVLKMAVAAIAIIIGVIIIAIGVTLVLAFAAVMAIINATVWVVTKIIEAIIWLGDQIAEAIWSIVEFGAAVKNTFSNARANINAAFASIGAWFSARISEIRGAFSAIPGFISGFFRNAINIAYSIFGSIGAWFRGKVSEIRNAFAGIPGMLGGIISDGMSRIVGVLGSFNLFASGRALIDGFTNGITSALGRAKDVVSGGLGKLRDLFPFSPAKDGPFSGRGYTSFSGMALMKDFAKGIADNSALAVLEASDTMTRLQSTFSTPMLAAVGATGNVYSARSEALTADDIWGDGTAAGSGGPQVVQNVYPSNDVDMDVVNDSLRRSLRRK